MFIVIFINYLTIASLKAKTLKDLLINFYFFYFFIIYIFKFNKWRRNLIFQKI